MVDDWKAILLKEKKDLLKEQDFLSKKHQSFQMYKILPEEDSKPHTYTPMTEEHIKDIERLEVIAKRLVEIDIALGIYHSDDKKPGD